jgi:hypothetical protein
MFRKIAKVRRFRKAVFSLVQVAFFALGIPKGNCRFRPRVVVGDWSHSKRRAKYLIVGTVIVDEDQVFVENWGEIYKLGASPQKEFFRKLEYGEDIHGDPYYIKTKQQLDAVAFKAWLHLKLELWENFKPDHRDFTPVAVRQSDRRFLVQDGAHRLSLRSLRGYNSHTLGIGLWDYDQKR